MNSGKFIIKYGWIKGQIKINSINTLISQNSVWNISLDSPNNVAFIFNHNLKTNYK